MTENRVETHSQTATAERNNVPAVVPSQQQPSALPAIGRNLSVWHRVDLSIPENAVAFYKAMNGQSVSWEDAKDKEIAIVQIVFQTKDQPDKDTGEIIRIDVGMAITDDGTVYAGTSTGVLESLQFMLTARPNMPYDPPVRVVVKAYNRLLKLDLVDLGLPTKSGNATGKKR